jgi:hypothetical protein
MNALLRHLWIRLGATLREPWALGVLVGTGVVTFAMWPAPMPASGPDLFFAGEREAAPLATMFVFMWIWLWPSLAGPTIGGRSAVAGLGSPVSVHPNPALPVGAKARVVAETLLLLVAVLLLRAPALFMGEWIHATFALPGAYPGDAAWMTAFVGRSLVGAAIMLPSVVAWVIPSGNPQAMFARAGIVVAIELIAMWAGLLATPGSAIATAGTLAVVQLRLVGREFHGLRTWWRRRGRRGRLSRPPLAPDRQLVRDFVLRPMPFALTLLGLQVLLVVGDATFFPKLHLLGEDGPGLLYMGSSLMLGASLGFLALRPMASAQAIAGVLGKVGYRPGDFVAAWSVLPVRRESVLRGVYLHGLLATGAIWAAAILTGIVSTWLDKGTVDASKFFGGSPGELLVPMVAVVPCIAGLLTAGAAGRKGKAMLAGITMIAVFHAHFALLILRAPVAIHAAYLLLAAALGGAPILTELRRDAPHE